MGYLCSGAGFLISEPENCFEQGDAPPAVVAVHLPEALNQSGIQCVSRMFKARGCGDLDGFVLYGKAYAWRRVVFYQWCERTGITVMRRYEMKRQSAEDIRLRKRGRTRGRCRHLDG